MAAAAMVLARRMTDAVSQTPGFRTHGTPPAWLVNLMGGLASLRLLIEFTVDKTRVQCPTLHAFVEELQVYVMEFMGAAGDWEHDLWLQSFSVPLHVQWAAPQEAQDVQEEMHNCMTALRRWFQDEAIDPLSSIQRRLAATVSLMDLGTDHYSAGVLQLVTEELEQASSFAAVLVRDLREALAARTDHVALEGPIEDTMDDAPADPPARE